MVGVAALPDGSRYNTAIQNPRVAFKDARLRASSVAVDRHGMPVVSAGGFALAYRMDTSSGSWAVRCFVRLTEGIEQRYAEVAAFLRTHVEPYWVPIEYQPDGLLVERSWWPITIMPWIDALPLTDWVGTHLADPRALVGAADRFTAIVGDLERAGAAHGDLQHGNVLVTPSGDLVLIDYDGMFVPALQGRGMPEVGHPNYQHPGRGAATFGPHLDRFSAAVIWTALTVTARRPALWSRFDTGENLLFTAKDFRSPGQSELFALLHQDAEGGRLAERLERLLGISVDRLPSLADFVAGNLPAPDPVPVSFAAVAPFPVLDLRRAAVLDLRYGQRVTAVGEVTDRYRGRTYRGDPFLFLKIGGRRGESLKIVLWSETLRGLSPAADAAIRVGTVVSATGMLSSHDGQAQIVLERAALLEQLGASRVVDLLGSAWSEPPPAARVTSGLQVGDVVEHDKFGQGVVVSVRGDMADVRFSAELKPIKFTTYPLRFIRRPTPARPAPAPRPVQPGSRGGVAAPARGAPASGYGAHQKEWEVLIASAAGSGHPPTPARPRAAPRPSTTPTPQAPPSAPGARHRDAGGVAATLLVAAVILALGALQAAGAVAAALWLGALIAVVLAVRAWS